ncbi:MAG: hypothetical protein H8D45_26640 [Bacteroidetes bacterium]|nr:hypothetical protein [Bacteroidota bacterium]
MTNRNKKYKVILYVGLFVFTLIFLYVNLPFNYEEDKPEPIGFFSDYYSYNMGLNYDKCRLESINNSVSNNVDFYFGCSSSQLKNSYERQSGIYMYYGNCGNTVVFDETLLFNELPDYFIEFPFDIDNIGRSCRSFSYYNGTWEKINLSIMPASHYNDKKNTLISEWTESPSILEFRFTSNNFFKQISYEKKAINYYVSDRWRWDEYLYSNIPDVFEIEIKIPNKYDIINIENYEISDEIHGIEKYEKFYIIKTDIMESKVFHIIIIEKDKQMLKTTITTIWVSFALKYSYDQIKKRIKN